MSEAPDPQPPNDPRKAMLVLVIVAAIAAAAWLVAKRMMADFAIQDCVMSGRSNCAPIDEGSR